MYQGRKLRKREMWHEVKLAQNSYENLSMSIIACDRSIIFICQKPTACNISVMVMGGVSWRGGSCKVAKPMTTTQLKMEDTCILRNVIEIFWQRKMTKVKIWTPSSLFKLQMAMAQSCKNTSTCLCKQPNTSIAIGRNWSVGVGCNSSFPWLELHWRQQIFELQSRLGK